MGKSKLKERQILVVIKEPGREPYVEPLFENTLESFQKAVGGYIETVTICTDLVLICNEEGKLRGLPFNFAALGQSFVGTVLAVGVNGDEFASLKGASVPMIMRTMGGGR